MDYEQDGLGSRVPTAFRQTYSSLGFTPQQAESVEGEALSYIVTLASPSPNHRSIFGRRGGGGLTKKERVRIVLKCCPWITDDSDIKSTHLYRS
jgi:hypothetical protein